MVHFIAWRLYIPKCPQVLGRFAGVVNGIACYFDSVSGWACPASVRIAQATNFCLVFLSSLHFSTFWLNLSFHQTVVKMSANKYSNLPYIVRDLPPSFS